GRKSDSTRVERQDYSGLIAHGGVEGLHSFARHRGEIDLILADVVMPDLDGPDMVKVIRREDPSIKVIFITGHRERLPNWAEETCGVLPKPFTASKLAAAVAQCLGAAPTRGAAT